MRGQQGCSRRAVLAAMTGAGALAIGGCSTPREVVVPVPPEPDPDQVLRHQVAAEIEPLLTAYDEVIAVTKGGRRAILVTLRRQVAAHVLALAGSASSASPSPEPSGTDPATTPPPTLPSAGSGSTAPPAATVRELVDLEAAAAARRLRQVAGAGPGLARLLASIAASNATHVTQLRRDLS